MTICIAVKVNDCIVFAADSATTIMAATPDGSRLPTRVYNHADKVFNLYRGLPVCAMTCGLGNFGAESVATVAKTIRHEIMSRDDVDPAKYTIKQITDIAYGRFLERYRALEDSVRASASFEFFVGGYSANACSSELWKFQFTADGPAEPACIADVNKCEIVWAGQPEACVRLVLGVSSSTIDVLKEAGLSEEQASDLFQMIRRRSAMPILEPAMPVSDAIRLGKFLAGTTANFVKFLPGADTVGGDLDIATVTKYEGFRWIERKHFYPQHLNRENDHVI